MRTSYIAKENDKWQLSSEIISSKISDEMILMSIEAGSYFTLDTVASRIWELLSENSLSLEELTEKLMEEYEVDRETCMKDVQEFINDMASKKLIIPVEENEQSKE